MQVSRGSYWKKSKSLFNHQYESVVVTGNNININPIGMAIRES